MEKYPLIKKWLGLTWHKINGSNSWYIRADELEEKLASGITTNGAVLGYVAFDKRDDAFICLKESTDLRATKIEELEKKVQDIMKEIEGLK